MLLKETTFIFFAVFISITFASIKSPEETIKDESKKLLNNFVNKYLEKFEGKIAEAETYLKEYSSSSSKSDDKNDDDKFTDIFKHFNLQSLSIKSMKKVMEGLKESISVIDEEKTLETFKEEITKLKKAVTKIAKFLTDFNEDGLKESFEKILKLFDEHKSDIELFENVLENPEKIPKQSILAETTSSSNSIVATKKYMIGFKCGEGEYSLIACEKGEELPFKRTVQIPRTPLEYFTGYSGGENDTEIIGRNLVKLPEEAFAYEITLEVDTENILNHNVKKILLDNSRFAKDLEKMVPSKSPVIGFMGELSFIYINNAKKEDGYKPLKSWNGNLGKELYISFDEKKPKFFEKAIESFKLNCNSVVHNILEAMSINSDAIPTFKSIGYNLTAASESNNEEVLFEYNNFDGTKKSESPSSLMTLLLKEHLKAIKEEIGEKPKEISLFIFDNFKDEEKKRVLKGLEAACQTLKLKCNFVESD
uniref:Uncharacterized protein n=1 Tax=Panagrolaimus superbus TaxID=310955 RepID=A0A914Z924_9BILA